MTSATLIGRVEARCWARSLSTIISTSSSKPTLGFQPSFSRALRRVADEQVDLGRPHEARVLHDVSGPVVDADLGERDVEQLADRVRLAGGDDVVVGLVLLQHPPHRLDVVAGEAPVALGVEVAQRDACPAGRARCAATAIDTLRVTNSGPRRGDSWLNRMPEQACMP